MLFASGTISPPIVHAAELDAELHWARKVIMSTPVSGVVSAVRVQVGEHVTKGQVLVQLDDRLLRANVVAQKAELKRALNDRDESQRELERTQELYDMTSLSDHDLKLAVIARDANEAAYQTTQAALLQVELELEYSAVRAPFNAWIISRQVEVGQTVISEQQAVPLVVLAEAGWMMARAKVSAVRAAKLKPGSKVSITVNGKNYSGKILSIAMEPKSTAADEYDVDSVFETGKNILRAGQSAKVNF
jgi:RND family efflux transporter MFP subunit